MIKVSILVSGFGCTALVYSLIKDKRFKVTIIKKKINKKNYNLRDLQN